MVMMWAVSALGSETKGCWAAQPQAALGVLRVAVPDGLLCLPGENLTFYEFSEDFYQTQVELPAKGECCALNVVLARFWGVSCARHKVST